MADDFLGLPQADPQLAPDYLGRQAPVAFEQPPALPVGGAGLGEPTGPGGDTASPGPGGAPSGGGGSAGLRTLGPSDLQKALGALGLSLKFADLAELVGGAISQDRPQQDAQGNPIFSAPGVDIPGANVTPQDIPAGPGGVTPGVDTLRPGLGPTYTAPGVMIPGANVTPRDIPAGPGGVNPGVDTFPAGTSPGPQSSVDFGGAIGGGVNSLMGLYTLLSALERDDAGAAAVGGAGTGAAIIQLAASGAFGPDIAAMAAPYAGPAAAGLGAATGLYSLGQGIANEDPASILTGAYGAAQGGLQLASSGALGANAAAAAAPAAGIATGLAVPAAWILASAVRALTRGAEQKMGQQKEQYDMARNAQVAAPKVAAGTRAAELGLMTGGDLASLREAAGLAADAVTNAPYLSHLAETQGDAGKYTKPLDVSWVTETRDYGDGRLDPLHKYQNALSTANLIRLNDAMARLGEPLTTDRTDLQRMAGFLFPETPKDAGAFQYGYFTDNEGNRRSEADVLNERFADAKLLDAINQGFYLGNMERAILDYYGRTDPAAAQHWQQIFSTLPEIPIGLSPEEVERNLAGVRSRSASRFGGEYAGPAFDPASLVRAAQEQAAAQDPRQAAEARLQSLFGPGAVPGRGASFPGGGAAFGEEMLTA